MNDERVFQWLADHDRRYHLNAYLFVLEALRYTQALYKKTRHVSGRQLLVGIAKFAKNRYGEMAYLVFENWGVQTPRDFGNIVFNLVEMGEVKKTADDRIEDFDVDFDLKSQLEKVEQSLG
ncbi:MAG: hypothetical protein GC154_00380 [bacterium]|nr:hypothetical protein [bacterium]